MPRECPLCHKSVEDEAERRILLFIMDDKNRDYDSIKNKLLFQSIKLEICIQVQMILLQRTILKIYKNQSLK